MARPIIKSGKFSAGSDLQCGENVVVDVAEEVIVGDRVVLGDNTYLGGRRVTIGSDFYGYSWGHPSTRWLARGWLEVGRGRIDEEDAILTVGDRSTFHDNRIDLARRVTVGDDVGLSPEVVIYTHGYWQSPLEGFPVDYAPVVIGDSVVVGFRSVILPGVGIGRKSVIGTQSVVSGILNPWGVYGGNPARLIREVSGGCEPEVSRTHIREVVWEYLGTLKYRGIDYATLYRDGTVVGVRGIQIDLETLRLEGEEDELTDDFRWFLFTRGFRVYTRRPFRKMGRKV